MRQDRLELERLVLIPRVNKNECARPRAEKGMVPRDMQGVPGERDAHVVTQPAFVNQVPRLHQSVTHDVRGAEEKTRDHDQNDRPRHRHPPAQRAVANSQYGQGGNGRHQRDPASLRSRVHHAHHHHQRRVKQDDARRPGKLRETAQRQCRADGHDQQAGEMVGAIVGAQPARGVMLLQLPIQVERHPVGMITEVVAEDHFTHAEPDQQIKQEDAIFAIDHAVAAGEENPGIGRDRHHFNARKIFRGRRQPADKGVEHKKHDGPVDRVDPTRRFVRRFPQRQPHPLQRQQKRHRAEQRQLAPQPGSAHHQGAGHQNGPQ